MSEGNGIVVNGMAPSPLAPNEYVDFMIGGKVLRIPELKLHDLKLAREPILYLDGNLWWADYADGVCRIISILAPEYGTAESLIRACSIPEARALSGSWNELLTKSGFEMLGEAPAAMESPGNGTLTPSSPNLGLEESVVETPM